MRKGIRTMFFSSPKADFSTSQCYTSASSPSMTPHSHHTFSASIIEENIESAEQIINKWDVEMSAYKKVGFLFEDDNRREAKVFINAVGELQSAMHFFLSEDSSSPPLLRAKNLMSVAMKRLEKEFYQILSARSRMFLDSESVSSRRSRASRWLSFSDFEDDDASENDCEIHEAENSISEVDRVSEKPMEDLKAIADCMISSGYGKECFNIYKILRKSIVDESLYNLGIEILSLSQTQKMDWNAIELKIKCWLNAVKVAVETLFYGERILCDFVFSSSGRIKESCFAEITKGALVLFSFPELVAKCKKSPEKVFRILDLYESLSDNWPEIESIFSYESTSAVRSQAMVSLLKLGEATRTMLSDFEKAIHKDSSKSPIPGGVVHPLTRYVMNYITFLADYSGVLSDIVADWPLPVQMTLPESYFSSPTSEDGDGSSAISVRLAWLILVLVCKLDSKAKLYNDVSLSYLFLANNLNYIVSKVPTSNLNLLLGEDWLMKHETKVKQYAINYERMGWGKVLASLPENPTMQITPEAARECFKRFSSAFEDAYRKQRSWVVSDRKLREQIKVSLARKLVSDYGTFYDKYWPMPRKEVGLKSIVIFTPEDIGNYLSDLLHGSGMVCEGRRRIHLPRHYQLRRSNKDVGIEQENNESVK